MNVYEAVRTRKSVRSYLDKPIEKDKLERIFSAARLAPSANNGQEWHLVAVTDKSVIKRLASEATKHGFIGDAPVIIAACADSAKGVMSCGIERHIVDTSIIIDHITLLSLEEDLGTCWIGGFDQDRAKEILGIPEGYVVVELLPIGYPQDPAPVSKNRKELSEILHWEKW